MKRLLVLWAAATALVVLTLVSLPESRLYGGMLYGSTGGGGGGGGPIAFVAGGDLGDNGGTTSSLTHAFSQSTGTNEGLVVAITGDNVFGNDDITSVTYNSLSGTLLAKNNVGDRYQYLYYIPLGNTTAGSHNVVITASSNHYLIAVCTEYSKIQQTTSPDGTATPAESHPTVSFNVTTAVANDWVVSGGWAKDSVFTGATGLTSRVVNATFQNLALYDSNGALGTGSHSFSMTSSGASSINIAAAALSPG